MTEEARQRAASKEEGVLTESPQKEGVSATEPTREI